jgi:AcrR family transcriptional regulator
VPKLWNATIEAHRREVGDAILDTASALVFEEGLRSVTMSQVAERTGIGRATLYKYFPDLESILRAWHARQIEDHLRRLTEARDRAPDAGRRLEAVLEAYAGICRSQGHHDAELSGVLHRDHQVTAARHEVHRLIQTLVAEAAAAGLVRADVSPHVLTTYCLHALAAAGSTPAPDDVPRLVQVVLTGLRPAAA